MRLPASLLLLALAAPALAQRVDVARRTPLPVRTSQEEIVREALRLAETRHAETVERWLEIVKVPALPGQEADRAKVYARMLREAGLEVRLLADGNVEGILRGTSKQPAAVLAAHLDALHVPSVEHPIVVQGQWITGPGVLDDGSGLVALVMAAQHLARAGYVPQRELRFVGTVGEEVGLLGARSYVATRGPLAAFVAVDGILGAVDYGATGITWVRYGFVGRGGHTLLANRTPSPAFAVGRAIASIADLAAATDEPVNVGVVEGGTVPNAIPTRVSFTVDVRSDDPQALARLERDIQRVAQAAADREGVQLEVETLQALPAVRLPGHSHSPLVAGASGILEWLGLSPATFPRGSADHNMALLQGIPGIAVGATIGRHAHAPGEVADVELIDTGVKQLVLLAVLLSEGLDEPPPAVGSAQ